MINYAEILIANYSNCEFNIIGNDYSGIEWLDVSPKPTQQELDVLWTQTQDNRAKEECKRQAQDLLAKTDWTTIPDVSDPTSSPYLVNYDEFKQYRSALRTLAVNPVTNPTFPIQPTEQWAN